MPAYAGRGQPTVTQSGGMGSWWNRTPSYTTGAVLVGMPTAACVDSPPTPGTRAISIMIPRDLTDGTPTR
jgi:hypothetical protein